MASKNDIACFDIVRYDGALYCALEIQPDPPHRGLIGIATKEHACQGWNIDFDHNVITIRHTVTACSIDGKYTVIARDTT